MSEYSPFRTMNGLTIHRKKHSIRHFRPIRFTGIFFMLTKYFIFSRRCFLPFTPSNKIESVYLFIVRNLKQMSIPQNYDLGMLSSPFVPPQKRQYS